MEVRSGSRSANEALRAARQRLNLSQDDLAKALRTNGWTSCDRRTIQRYESGEVTRPRPFARRALTGLFGMNIAALGFSAYEDEEADDVNRRQLLALTTAAAVNGTADTIGEATAHIHSAARAGGTLTDYPAEDVERRALLQALTVLGAAAPAAEAVRTIRSSIDTVLGRDELLQVRDWEEIVSEHGFGYVALPPADLLPGVAADLVAVRNIMTRTGPRGPQQRDWSRILAGLAMIMAKLLANLGQSREARRWWSTSLHACELSGDARLGLWVNAERVFHGMYDQRPPAALLHQIDQIAARYSETPSRGLAPIRTGRAQLLAMLGRGTEALEELHRAQSVYEQLPATVTGGTESIAFWGIDRLHYTETWIHAHSGNAAGMAEAAARAHASIPESQERAHVQLRLLEAFGHVQSGDLRIGTATATSAYECLSPEQRTTMVTGLAQLVLDAVPHTRRIEATVAEYIELLADASQPRPSAFT